MIKYGILSLDELRAVRYARRILSPFVGVSSDLLLTDKALAEREQVILASEEFNVAVGDAYDLPCANLSEAEFRNSKTGETKSSLTCSVETCRFAGKAVDPAAERMDCDSYKVSQQYLDSVLLR